MIDAAVGTDKHQGKSGRPFFGPQQQQSRTVVQQQ